MTRPTLPPVTPDEYCRALAIERDHRCTCDQCKWAHRTVTRWRNQQNPDRLQRLAADKRRTMAAARQTPRDLIPADVHGTKQGWYYYGCTCLACDDNHKQFNRRKAAQMRERRAGETR